MFLEHALSPKKELSFVASVEDSGDGIVDDIHVEVTLGSTTLWLDPRASERGTTFTSLAPASKSATFSHLNISSSSLENVLIVS